MLTDSQFKQVFFQAKMVITAMINDEPCDFKAEDVLKTLDNLVSNQNNYLLEPWDVDDVIYRAQELGITLTQSEACAVLENIDNHYDANNGINWDVIDCTIEAVYPDKLKERTTILDEIIESFS